MTQMAAGSPSAQATNSALSLDLAMAASAKERANRSRVLIVLAMIMLIAAAIYALTGFLARSEAADRVATQVRSADNTRLLAQRFRAATEGQADARFAADPLLGSKLERLAESVGLKLNGPVAFVELPDIGGVPGMVRRKFSARASNADPAVLLQFLISAQDAQSYPGLDITSIVLRPSGRASGAEATHDGGWELQVDFTRWERRSS